MYVCVKNILQVRALHHPCVLERPKPILRARLPVVLGTLLRRRAVLNKPDGAIADSDTGAQLEDMLASVVTEMPVVADAVLAKTFLKVLTQGRMGGWRACGRQEYIVSQVCAPAGILGPVISESS